MRLCNDFEFACIYCRRIDELADKLALRADRRTDTTLHGKTTAAAAAHLKNNFPLNFRDLQFRFLHSKFLDFSLFNLSRALICKKRRTPLPRYSLLFVGLLYSKIKCGSIRSFVHTVELRYSAYQRTAQINVL